MATLEVQVARFLNDHLFATVWNQPQREFRKVVIPTLVSSRALHGTWNSGFSQVTLPDPKRNYFVYRIPTASLAGVPLFPKSVERAVGLRANSSTLTGLTSVAGITIGMNVAGAGIPKDTKVVSIDAETLVVTISTSIPAAGLIVVNAGNAYSVMAKFYWEWRTLSTIMDDNRLDFRVYGEYGEMLYRDAIYIIPHTSDEHFLLAIENRMAMKLLTNPEAMENVKLSIYYDTDANANLQTWHYQITAANQAEAWVNASNTDKELVFVNGLLPDLSAMTGFTTGDYVECVDDGDVLCEFTIDPFAATTRTYFSAVREQPAFIVHIPKALNPDYHMLTHNTCDVYAMPKSGAPGIMVHRAYSNTRGFVQLTHADFAIPINVMGDYLSYFAGQYTLRIIVREHDADNLMMRDVNYIDVLYLHSDQQIVDFMADDHTPMDFWKATVLEQSKYVYFMFYYLRDHSTNNIADIVDALGYYQTLSLICPQIQRISITEGMTRTFDIPLPLLFSHKQNTLPHVFVDGQKIHDELVTYVSDGETLTITLDPSVPFLVGGELVVELQEDDTHVLIRFSPTNESPTITIPVSDYQVFEELRYTLPMGEPFVYGVDHTSNESYRQVVPNQTYTAVVGENDEVQLTFLPHIYTSPTGDPVDRTFVIQNTIGIHRFTEADAPSMLSGAIQLALLGTASDGFPCPLVGEFAPIVYMNGKSLVEGVDFQLITKTVGTNGASFSQIVIQNISYLLETDNSFEIYLRRGRNVVTEFGHPTPGNPTGLNELFLWFPSLSMAYTNGMIISNAGVRHGLFTMESLPSTYGALSGARTSVTYYTNSVLSSLAADDDTVKITALRAYLKAWLTADEPPIVEIPGSHRIYSVYIGMIVRALLDAYSATTDEESVNITDIYRTYTRQYAYLKRMDIAYTQELDRRFIDVYPWYRKLPVTNRRLYNMIQKLAQEVTERPDTITDGDLLQ